MQNINYFVVSFFVIPLAIIILNNILPKKSARKAGIYLAGAGTILQIAAAVTTFVLMSVSNTQKVEFALLWDIKAAGAGRFEVNALSLLLLLCIGFVSFISVMIANQTVKKKRISYVNLLMTLILGMNGMVMVTDLFSLYVFLEIIGISSFVLIAMFQSETGLEGAFKYLVMSAMASIFILTGLSLIFMQAGSLQFSQVGMSAVGGQAAANPVFSYLAFILLLAGFAVKTGAVPFHSWLPDAHQSADTSVSVLLSGIVIKVAGIYGIIVLLKLFPNVPAINMTLAIMGIVSIITGALFALRQTHFKRIVAYSSVSQMGYILLGLSTGSVLGLIGAAAHIFNHATFKSTLFSNAAALHEQAGTLDIDEMGGLQSKMPVTGISSIIAFLSTAGIPPLAGFWSKLLIIMALWAGNARVFAGIALFSSIFTAAYFLRMQKKVFFGKLPEKFADLKEIGGSIKFAEIILTAVMIIVGVAFPFVLIYLKSKGII